jgi:hypothetical protein
VSNHMEMRYTVTKVYYDKGYTFAVQSCGM